MRHILARSSDLPSPSDDQVQNPIPPKGPSCHEPSLKGESAMSPATNKRALDTHCSINAWISRADFAVPITQPASAVVALESIRRPSSTRPVACRETIVVSLKVESGYTHTTLPLEVSFNRSRCTRFVESIPLMPSTACASIHVGLSNVSSLNYTITNREHLQDLTPRPPSPLSI